MLFIRIHAYDNIKLRPPVLNGVRLQYPAPIKEPAPVQREVYKARLVICPHKLRGGIPQSLHGKQHSFVGASKLAYLLIHGYP